MVPISSQKLQGHQIEKQRFRDDLIQWFSKRGPSSSGGSIWEFRNVNVVDSDRRVPMH